MNSPLSYPLSSVPGSDCSIALMGALAVLHDTDQVPTDLFFYFSYSHYIKKEYNALFCILLFLLRVSWKFSLSLF